MSSYQLYNQVTAETSKQTTLMYSSSFSSAIKLLHKDLRQPIYDVYGLVRYADEIVDTFHDFDKAKLLAQFKIDTYTAIEQGISLNPILHRFQLTFRKYNIGQDLVEAFFNSMEMDLNKRQITFSRHDVLNRFWGVRFTVTPANSKQKKELRGLAFF